MFEVKRKGLQRMRREDGLYFSDFSVVRSRDEFHLVSALSK